MSLWSLVISDITCLSYVIVSIVSLYGFFLFLWWWFETGKGNVPPSAVYVYVMFLLLGIGISNTMTFVARLFYLMESVDFDTFLSSRLWVARVWIILLSVSGIVGHMTVRVYNEYFRNR